jgi:drug/metabolite transporter (DMT)-like permease
LTDRKKGFVLLIIASILWSTGGMLLKLVSWNGFAVGGFRSLVSAVFISFFAKGINLKFTKWRVIAMVSYASTVILFAVANKMTTAANAIMLQYTAPVYAAIFGARILGEKLRKRDILSIVVVLSGMVLFAAEGLQGGHFFGDTLAILSGVTFAMVAVALKVEKDVDPVQNIFWGNVLAFAISVPFMRDITLTFYNISGVILLGIFQLGLAYVLYARGMRYVTALEGSIIPMFEPILNPVWVFLSIGETPGHLAILGGAVIIFGIFMREIIDFCQKRIVKESPSS